MNLSDTPRRPIVEDPDPRALELASMCDLVVNGTATAVSVTLPRPTDPADLTVLADSITAARGLYAEIELAADTITIHITGDDSPEGASRG